MGQMNYHIYFAKTCALYDYKDHLEVNRIQYHQSGIVISYSGRRLYIPSSNILGMEISK